jgi:hypothetical protein
MTIGDLFEIMLESGYPVDANNDYELRMMDDRPITNIAVSVSDGIIYLGDVDEDDEEFQKVVINL